MEQLNGEIKEAARRGLQCSQIIVDIGLRRLGMRSECLIKGTAGLVGAMGLQDATCGALTGAASLIAFAAIDRLGQGIYLLIEELEGRFDELISEYPGNTCGAILEHDPSKVPTEVCPPIIAGALRIALEVLADAGIGVPKDSRTTRGDSGWELALEEEAESGLTP
jgi:hypothetical protein